MLTQMAEQSDMSASEFLENDNRNLKTLILSLQARFGRLPTEEEVLGFIYGDQEQREEIWNSDNTPESVPYEHTG